MWGGLAAAVLIALALAATDLHLTGGDNRGIPITTEAARGLKIMEDTLGPGALAPQQVVIDTHRRDGVSDAAVVAAQRRLVAQLRRDPEAVPKTVLAPFLVPRAVARQANLVDDAGRVGQIRAAGHSDAGEAPAVALVHRIRDRYLPAARFPASTDVLLTGAPAFGVDFIDKSYGAFPWLVLAVLVISYLLLLRAFRSVFLPLKAVIMNLLSVSAAYGLLTLAFEHGWGKAIGLQSSPQIEAWIPIFLFAVLFGLSMDYEVFLLSRMREEWDQRHDNEHAVAYGLEHTGPHHHRLRDHHDRRLLGLHLRQLRRATGVRPRALGRDPARRDARPRRARARGDEDHGRLELVPARARAPGAAGAGRARAGDRVVRARAPRRRLVADARRTAPPGRPPAAHRGAAGRRRARA